MLLLHTVSVCLSNIHGPSLAAPIHVHRCRTDGLRYHYVCCAFATQRLRDDRSATRTRHLVLRRMADGIRKPRHTQHASGRRAADIVRHRWWEAWASRARRSDGRNRQSRDEPVHEEEPPFRHIRDLHRTESVFEKQGEPHHQFECTVHDIVQKPARRVSARKLGQTDVPRSRRVRPGGVRPCDSPALRLSSGQPETEHARRHASAHVSTAGRFTPVGLRTEGV